MKSCRNCFEYAYVFLGGDVRLCPWNYIVIGNLLEKNLEEIWTGEKAEEIREAFKRGELLGCNESYCPYCINNSSRLEIEPEELNRMHREMANIPVQISLAYDERCNHACPSCRHEIFLPSKEYMEKLDLITRNIEPYLKKAKRVVTNGIGELFVSTEIVDMLSRLEPEDPDFSIFLETNGVLFKKNWDKIKHLAGRNITVSVTPNSFDRETYKYLAGRDDLEQFEESLAFIAELKHQGAISKIRLIMVIQDSNFRQIPQFIYKGIDYDVDDIVLRPIFKWFGMNEDEVLYKNVLNPCHPYHKEYLEIIKNPICQDHRVYNWGYLDKQKPIEFPTLEMIRTIKQDGEFDAMVCEQANELRKDLEGKRVLLYGVGKVGQILLKYLTTGCKKIDIIGFAVTCADCNKYYMGYKIEQIENYKNEKNMVVVLATINKMFQKEMLDNCKELNITSVFEMNCF